MSHAYYFIIGIDNSVTIHIFVFNITGAKQST